MNIYRVLDSDDEDIFDYESYDDEYPTYQDFGKKEVEELYKYFLHEGKGDDGKLSWKVNIQHIYWALRKNFGNVVMAGRDLEQLLKNINLNIRQYYTKKSNGDHEIVDMPSKVPYLEGQEWLIEPKEGLYLLYKDQVYQILNVHKERLIIDRVLTNSVCYKTVYYADEEVMFGEYKYIDAKQRQYYLEKEYENICKKYEEISKEKNDWIKNKEIKIQDCIDEFDSIDKYHMSNCSVNAKLPLIGKLDLPIDCIRKITEYGIYTNCQHLSRKYELTRRIQLLYYEMNKGFIQYELIKHDKETAMHIIESHRYLFLKN